MGDWMCLESGSQLIHPAKTSTIFSICFSWQAYASWKIQALGGGMTVQTEQQFVFVQLSEHCHSQYFPIIWLSPPKSTDQDLSGLPSCIPFMLTSLSSNRLRPWRPKGPMVLHPVVAGFTVCPSWRLCRTTSKCTWTGFSYASPHLNLETAYSLLKKKMGRLYWLSSEHIHGPQEPLLSPVSSSFKSPPDLLVLLLLLLLWFVPSFPFCR